MRRERESARIAGRFILHRRSKGSGRLLLLTMAMAMRETDDTGGST